MRVVLLLVTGALLATLVATSDAAPRRPAAAWALTYDGLYEIGANGLGRRRLLGNLGVRVEDVAPTSDRVVGWTDRGLETVSLDGSSRQLIASVPRNEVAGARARWSPDGRIIAFERFDQSPCRRPGSDGIGCAIAEIWLVRPDGTRLRRLTDHAYGPAWSPSGYRLAFVGRASGDTNLGVMSVSDINGRNRRSLHRELTNLLGPSWSRTDPAWSRSGTCVAYSVDNSSQGLKPWLLAHLDCEGKAHRTLGARLVLGWAPESRMTTIRRRIRKGKRYWDLEMVSLTGSTQRLASARGIGPTAWARNARWLAYVVSTDTQGDAQTPQIWTSQLHVTTPGGKIRRQVTLEPQGTRIERLFWSHDGRRLFYTRYDASS